jgi:hypothetical protein
MATHAHLMIDPMADGTPALPATMRDDHITRAVSRTSYRKEKEELADGEVEEVPRLGGEEMPEGPTTGKYEEWAYVRTVSQP